MNRVTGPGLPAGTADPDNGAWYGFKTVGSSPALETGLLETVTIKDASANTLGFTTWSYETHRDLVAGVENKFYFGAGTATTVSKYAYVNDSRARRQGVQYTGAAFSGSGHVDDWVYNPRNELRGTDRRAYDATIDDNPTDETFDTTSDAGDRRYAYDPIGNRASKTEGTDPTVAYVPNELNQYEEANVTSPRSGQRFAHDLDGNLIEQFAASDLDGDGDVDDDDETEFNSYYGQTCSWCAANPNDCNMEHFARADSDDNCTIGFADLVAFLSYYGQAQSGVLRAAYKWDAENRLIEWRPFSPKSGSVKVNFTYDYRGRRIEKRISEWDTSASDWKANPKERRRFVWNGWLKVMEIIDIDAASDGTYETRRIKKYTWGRDLGGGLESAGGIGGLLSVSDDNATPGSSGDDINLVYCYDANGNVGQLVDYLETSAAAGIKAKYEYDAYGNVTASGGTYATANTFRFSTKYWDDETGLGYWGERYYDPRIGRWTNRDPIGERGGIGLHQYVVNAPVNSVDPVGLIPPEWDKPFGEGLDLHPCSKCDDCWQTCLENQEKFFKTPPPGQTTPPIGVVICREDGCRCACSNEGRLAPIISHPVGDALRACTLLHEENHVRSRRTRCDCSPKPCLSSHYVSDQKDEECDAYAAEFDCLCGRLNTCGPDKWCKQQIRKIMATAVAECAALGGDVYQHGAHSCPKGADED